MSSEFKEKNLQNIRVLENLLENEQKSKIYTVIVVLGFCILGGLILYLGLELSSKANELKKQLHEKELLIAEKSGLLSEKEKLIAERDSALIRLDSLQTSLVNTNSLLSQTALEADSIKQQSLNLLTQVQHEFEKLNNDYIQVQKKYKLETKPVEEEKIKDQVQKIDKLSKKYKCYIQYMPGFEADAKRAYLALDQKEWYNQFSASIDKIEDQSFDTYIKYFDKSDQKLANEMYRTLMNAKIEVTREPVLVDAPGAVNKFEVWIGKQKRKSVEDVLNNPRYQNKLNMMNRK
ncbi:MAG: hypothetical protein IPK91_09855 [Saprospiraceae bacterium]|jgi:hypothetical protein|nr:hypothetical protein [Saprospiraceae bacterium]MBK8297561.1 hypothetical protein [Saprospiraceae bacterium]